jgi:FtsP/CotA-like multicopper oxidase with cupredoxin domain
MIPLAAAPVGRLTISKVDSESQHRLFCRRFKKPGGFPLKIDRRVFLAGSALFSMAGPVSRLVHGAEASPPASVEKADCTMRIATGLAELAPDHIVSTTLYNGQFPGPLLRFKEGKRAVVDIHNETDVPELVHWHGQIIPSDVDGAAGL